MLNYLKDIEENIKVSVTQMAAVKFEEVVSRHRCPITFHDFKMGDKVVRRRGRILPGGGRANDVFFRPSSFFKMLKAEGAESDILLSKDPTNRLPVRRGNIDYMMYS